VCLKVSVCECACVKVCVYLCFGGERDKTVFELGAGSHFYRAETFPECKCVT